ncbi:uridine phosphorylase [Lactococcus hodotermopsidis]|uniref:Uridine phosphorylase n=1 Tax=Pseudolactococcus hodotermopsidis TaxID=2709157 RepID=A0A6A0BCU8_9LACT|nr:nucleoside phosphorylase [Lactococcus hodotermopsidis]GFH42188.1 uridine phosphorylase [Lactococcus hodotermopsidis]
MILDEFENGRAVIEPSLTDATVYEVCDVMVMPFSSDIMAQILATGQARIGGYTHDINGADPWYIYENKGLKVGVVMAEIGAPVVVGLLEELQAVGFKKFVIFGTCGVLDSKLCVDRLIVPTAAIRDEGTSYHYAPSSDEILISKVFVEKMVTVFEKLNLSYTLAKTWTTDAFFRETAEKAKRRLAAGATVVDMECSAIQAWAQYRKKEVYQFFYTADEVDHENEKWDRREAHKKVDVRHFFEIALKIAGELDD